MTRFSFPTISSRRESLHYDSIHQTPKSQVRRQRFGLGDNILEWYQIEL